jgi:hypothetical protein
MDKNSLLNKPIITGDSPRYLIDQDEYNEKYEEEWELRKWERRRGLHWTEKVALGFLSIMVLALLGAIYVLGVIHDKL